MSRYLNAGLVVVVLALVALVHQQSNQIEIQREIINEMILQQDETLKHVTLLSDEVMHLAEWQMNLGLEPDQVHSAEYLEWLAE